MYGIEVDVHMCVMLVYVVVCNANKLTFYNNFTLHNISVCSIVLLVDQITESTIGIVVFTVFLRMYSFEMIKIGIVTTTNIY